MRGVCIVSETEGKYAVNIAQSDKKASTVVDSFKVRKSGNSSIVTVPNVVKETLNVKDGEKIQYITVKDENDESIVVIKKMDLDNTTDSHIDKDVKKLLEQTHKKYDDILTALAEL